MTQPEQPLSSLPPEPMSWASRPRQGWRLVAGLLLAFLLFIYWFIPPVWRLRKGPITITRWPLSGEQRLDVGPGTPSWVPISRVSRHVLHAFIAAEDGKFYQHAGFDYEAIASAYEANAKHKRIMRGASTISQQVVKMAFLSNDRNYVRKAREAAGTFFLEKWLTKDQILEWYINMAEFGDGVFGIKAAAKHYFQTKPELLTIQQGANLALVLPSPNKWSKGLRSRRLTPFGQKRYARIINNMYYAGYITNVLRMTALATGDFGRPVMAFSEIKRKMNANEPLNFNREPDEEELALEQKENEGDNDGHGNTSDGTTTTAQQTTSEAQATSESASSATETSTTSTTSPSSSAAAIPSATATTTEMVTSEPIAPAPTASPHEETPAPSTSHDQQE